MTAKQRVNTNSILVSREEKDLMNEGYRYRGQLCLELFFAMVDNQYPQLLMYIHY